MCKDFQFSFCKSLLVPKRLVFQNTVTIYNVIKSDHEVNCTLAIVSCGQTTFSHILGGWGRGGGKGLVQLQ